MPSILRIGLPVVGICILVAGTTYLVRAFDSRSMPALAAEHRIRFSSEFAADDETAVDWAGYLAIEEALARELADRIDGVRAAGNQLDRHWPDSTTYPPAIGGNWNRSYQLSSVAPRGTAVLLHGLSDSPYSMLATAQTLVGAGYDVVVPRLPGHGFAVGGLRQSRWQDWAAAVRVAVRHAMTLPGSNGSFVLAGYSNGGLLALHYALSCADDGMPCPERLLLLSPALAVSPFAAVANWHAALS
ncbi:MAG: alpha/beta hydrolase, partial [Woeseiaceae bacterium]